MNNHFRRATRRLAPEDILTSSSPPFEGFVLPPVINSLYTDISRQQENVGHKVEGGFAFGGLFYDVHRGKKPKDMDVYIAIPQLLTNIEDRLAQGRSSYREMEECDEDIARYFGYDFPIHLHQIEMSPVKADLFGSYITAQTIYEKDGQSSVFDIIIGKNPVALKDFLPYTHSIMAVGASLGENTEYAFHKDYVECVSQKILCCDNPTRSTIEKAQTKGWTIMDPAAFQARQVEQAADRAIINAKQSAEPTLEI